MREQVDALVLRDEMLRAVRVAMEAAQVLEEFQGARPGPYECQRAVMDRYQALAGRIVRTPEPPQDAETPAAVMSRLDGRPAAVEAVWDGDTNGWFVVLVAVLDDPEGEVELARIRHGSDLRVFNAQVPPWPEAQEAIETGTVLAERFGVPFYFASPDEPDDEAPRWRQSRAAL
ncbi:hypothetical protein ACFQ6V_11300 [Streptomyces roseifaciens]